jgi:hypothetical protein
MIHGALSTAGIMAICIFIVNITEILCEVGVVIYRIIFGINIKYNIAWIPGSVGVIGTVMIARQVVSSGIWQYQMRAMIMTTIVIWIYLTIAIITETRNWKGSYFFLLIFLASPFVVVAGKVVVYIFPNIT